MSDPKREDLRVLKPCNLDPASPSSQHRHTEDVTDAEFDAIVDADPRWVRADEVAEARQGWINAHEALRILLAEWERLGVKAWEDCPRSDCKIPTCPNCGGSGKVLAEGVMDVVAGWLQRRFGLTTRAAEHADPMTADDWRYLADGLLTELFGERR